jgi:hypothetical protein
MWSTGRIEHRHDSARLRNTLPTIDDELHSYIAKNDQDHDSIDNGLYGFEFDIEWVAELVQQCSMEDQRELGEEGGLSSVGIALDLLRLKWIECLEVLALVVGL